jgi:hypothetical protein
MNTEKNAIVHSSHGDIEINKDGIPLLKEEWVCEVRFDLEEYAKTYPDEPYPDEYDILDLCAWYYNGDNVLDYCNASESFRELQGK